MEMTKKQTVYWIGGNCLFSAEAIWWDGEGKSGYFKDATTTEVVKDYGSTEEAEKAFHELMKTLGENSKFSNRK